MVYQNGSEGDASVYSTKDLTALWLLYMAFTVLVNLGISLVNFSG